MKNAGAFLKPDATHESQRKSADSISRQTNSFHFLIHLATNSHYCEFLNPV